MYPRALPWAGMLRPFGASLVKNIPQAPYHGTKQVLWITIILFLFTIPCQARDFRHLSVEQGLSQSSVYSIAQDAQGFMWFATQNGLNRFDGYRFVQYPHSLPSNEIQALLVDSNGQLWVGHGQGLSRYDSQQARFIHVDKTWGAVWSVYEDSRAGLWAATQNQGLFWRQKNSQQWQNFRHQEDDPNSLSSNAIWPLVEDAQGHLWVGTDGDGLNLLQQQPDGAWHIERHQLAKDLENSAFITSLHRDSRDNIWVGSAAGLFLLEQNSNAPSFKHYQQQPNNSNSLSHNLVWHISEDASGFLWIATDGGGLNRFDPQYQRFEHFRQHKAEPESLSNDHVLVSFFDKQGNLWVGTDGGGINLSYASQTLFEHEHHKWQQPDNSLSHNVVLALLKDRNGALWVGTDGGGLNRYSPDRQHVTHYRHQAKQPQSLANDSVHALLEDTQGRLWVGTYGGVLHQAQWQADGSLHWQRYFEDDNVNIINAILEDAQGKLWVGRRDGLLHFEPDTGQFKQYVHDPKQPQSLSHDFVYALYQDSSGEIWAATHKGLNRLVIDAQGQVSFEHFLADKAIFTLAESNAELWLGSDTLLKQADGKPHPHFHGQDISAMLTDSKGDLWISARNGLFQFNPSNNKVLGYDVRDGLQSSEFKLSAAHHGADGEMFFGGINGFNSFYPQRLPPKPQTAPLQLTGFKLFNQDIGIGDVLPKSINQLEQIKLDYQQSFFSFEFALLNFKTTDNNHYRYRLQGFDPDWREVGNKNYADYTNVPPGQYQFHFAGSANQRQWSAQQIRVHIAPPPWKTPRAYVAYVLLALLLLWLLLNWWQGRKRAQQRLFDALQEKISALEESKEKSRYLATASHELRQPLHALKLQTTLLLQRLNDAPAPQRKLAVQVDKVAAEINHLIGTLLDLSRLNAGVVKVNRQDFPLQPLLQSVYKEFLPQAEAKNLSLEVSTEQAVLVHSDLVLLTRILRNLLDNAINNTAHGRIELIAETREQGLYLRVKDTGSGISPAHRETIFQAFQQIGKERGKHGLGLGLSIVKQLCELLGHELSLESTLHQGSCFSLCLAYQAEEIQESPPEPFEFSGHVLVVDDEAEILETSTEILEDWGYAVTAVQSIAAVEQLLQQGEQFDVVISDYHLQSAETGLDVIKMVREHQGKAIPALIISGDKVVLENKLDVRVLLKPVDPRVLYESLK